MFDSALAQNHENTLKICKNMWKHVYTNQKPTSTRPPHHEMQEQHVLHSTPPLFAKYKTSECPTIMHINVIQHETQWTKPYSDRTFCSQDIALEDFMSVLLRYDVFAKRFVRTYVTFFIFGAFFFSSMYIFFFYVRTYVHSLPYTFFLYFFVFFFFFNCKMELCFISSTYL